MHLAELALANRTEDAEFLEREYAGHRRRARHRLDRAGAMGLPARITKLSRPTSSSARVAGSTTRAKCMKTPASISKTRQHQPHAARNWLKALRHLMAHCVAAGLIAEHKIR